MDKTVNWSVGDDLVILKQTRQAAGSGVWVCGSVAGHRFDALVFVDHAVDESFEIGKSRISKLWVQQLDNRSEVFHWDRGSDVEAKTEAAQAVVDFLCAGLAGLVFGV